MFNHFWPDERLQTAADIEFLKSWYHWTKLEILTHTLGTQIAIIGKYIWSNTVGGLKKTTFTFALLDDTLVWYWFDFKPDQFWCWKHIGLKAFNDLGMMLEANVIDIH